jgi:hypothetical protein
MTGYVVKERAGQYTFVREDKGKKRKPDKPPRSDKSHCALCGRYFEPPLTIACLGGYICEPCRRDGPPAPPPEQIQSKLPGGGEV